MPYRPSPRLRDLAGQIANLELRELLWLRDKMAEALGDDDDDQEEGGTGVREPRRVPPAPDSGEVALEEVALATLIEELL